ncbi:MAG: DUF479 domain-containing protein [Ferruginibacter sp.]|nr:DUF479 domain-containing protein [Cytophagales bacterium]
MNFLAHLYLSGPEEEVLLGNFMADFVKGRPENRLSATQTSEGILRGIRLHRHIDSFTDTHPIVGQSKLRLRPAYRKYAGVITDVYYDHFLAAHWSDYADVSLEVFADRTYRTLRRNQDRLPAGMERMLDIMTQQNWLVSYARVEGIERALQGLARRTSFESGMETAATALRLDYEAYYGEFKAFFPRLVESVHPFWRVDSPQVG